MSLFNFACCFYFLYFFLVVEDVHVDDELALALDFAEGLNK